MALPRAPRPQPVALPASPGCSATAGSDSDVTKPVSHPHTPSPPRCDPGAGSERRPPPLSWASRGDSFESWRWPGDEGQRVLGNRRGLRSCWGSVFIYRGVDS